MGGKKGQELGKALIKRKNVAKQVPRKEKEQATSLQSIMEFTDLQLVIEQAEEAGRIYSELNPPPQLVYHGQEGPSHAEKQKEEMLHASSLTVPRRPKWHKKMTVEELDNQERQAFLNWRRGLARLEENDKLILTPFEKNLEVWRQLWRVIERCDLVVMVVDARNPLFYRCPDLEVYVKELDENKRILLLLNKSDLLPTSMRKKWAEYFRDLGLDHVFWSAKHATERLEGKSEQHEVIVDDDEDVPVLDREELLTLLQTKAEGIQNRRKAGNDDVASSSSYDGSSVRDSSEGRVAVGFVGYPNVGKSSTINVLVGQKRTGVTSTPGKTKHFQTLIINEKLLLCDCPGLVFPSFTSSKADMVAAGVLPVDKMTDYRGPIQVIVHQIPRRKLEEEYGLTLPKPKHYEDPNRTPTAAEFLRAYAQSRGYVISSGLPDETRSARQILKDYLNGRLLYCHPPPNVAADTDIEDEADITEEEEDSAGSEEDEEEGSEIDDEETDVTGPNAPDENSQLDEIFRDVDLKTEAVKVVKTKRAAHKIHKKAPRKKDRSWRAQDDGSDGMALVKGVALPVSYGAAPR